MPIPTINLRSVRVFVLFASATSMLFWLLKGAHTGWTRSLESTIVMDPVTEIEFPVFSPVFVPGVDFILFTLLPSIFLIIVLSVLIRLKPKFAL